MTLLTRPNLLTIGVLAPGAIKGRYSVLPLNLQDYLILKELRIVGMYHEGNKGAILIVTQLADQDYNELREILEAEGYAVVKRIADSFALSMWTAEGCEGCAAYLHRTIVNKENKTHEAHQSPPR